MGETADGEGKPTPSARPLDNDNYYGRFQIRRYKGQMNWSPAAVLESHFQIGHQSPGSRSETLHTKKFRGRSVTAYLPCVTRPDPCLRLLARVDAKSRSSARSGSNSITRGRNPVPRCHSASRPLGFAPPVRIQKRTVLETVSWLRL